MKNMRRKNNNNTISVPHYYVGEPFYFKLSETKLWQDIYSKNQQVLTAGIKCCVAPRFHLSVVIFFFWSFGINESNTFSIENWIPLLKACARGARDVVRALFIIFHEHVQTETETAIFISLLWFGCSRRGKLTYTCNIMRLEIYICQSMLLTIRSDFWE